MATNFLYFIIKNTNSGQLTTIRTNGIFSNYIIFELAME